MCGSYAPIAWSNDQKANDSERLYDHYLNADKPLRPSFLEYSRLYKFEGGRLKPFAAMGKDTISIGVRYCSELKDNYIGQLASTNMPHSSREQLQGTGETEFAYVRCLLGFINYLMLLNGSPMEISRLPAATTMPTRAAILCPCLLLAVVLYSEPGRMHLITLYY